jgi:hypothetical protein
VKTTTKHNSRLYCKTVFLILFLTLAIPIPIITLYQNSLCSLQILNQNVSFACFLFLSFERDVEHHIYKTITNAIKTKRRRVKSNPVQLNSHSPLFVLENLSCSSDSLPHLSSNQKYFMQDSCVLRLSLNMLVVYAFNKIRFLKLIHSLQISFLCRYSSTYVYNTCVYIASLQVKLEENEWMGYWWAVGWIFFSDHTWCFCIYCFKISKDYSWCWDVREDRIESKKRHDIFMYAKSENEIVRFSSTYSHYTIFHLPQISFIRDEEGFKHGDLSQPKYMAQLERVTGLKHLRRMDLLLAKFTIFSLF